MTHNQLFSEIPVGSSVFTHWAAQNEALLDSAAEKIVAHGANEWVFSADARHFWQFAGSAEVRALNALTEDERRAILGEWEDDDWYSETFGYSYPGA